MMSTGWSAKCGMFYDEIVIIAKHYDDVVWASSLIIQLLAIQLFIH